VSSFQRARTGEQREERRRVILETAAVMLEDMPVSAMSLNELSRRVGLAKSNVLRYFESREAVLLDLLDATASQWLASAVKRVPTAVDASLPAQRRVDAVATALATAFADAPLLCELLSVQAGVLERNISTEVALRYKQGTRDNLDGFAALLQEMLPELETAEAVPAVRMIIVLVEALWTRTHPPEAVIEAYNADSTLAFLNQDFVQALQPAIAICLAGFLARQALNRH
jgi:AcrR family transcriptional regulator